MYRKYSKDMEHGVITGPADEQHAQHIRTQNNNNTLTKDHVDCHIHRPLDPLPVNGSPFSRRSKYTGRKLVLHFDVRNTILVADSVDNISVEQAVNSFLTGVTWGKQTTSGWQWASDKPSLQCPDPESETYYKHLEKQLVRVPSDRVRLRRMTGDFAQEDIGRKFDKYFHRTLNNLEWVHPNANGEQLTMKGKDGKLYHYILPSFYKLIHHLHCQNRDFSIVIRTYGLDAYNVLKSIKLTMMGSHPQFPEKLPISVDTTYGKIHRKEDKISMHVQSETRRPFVLDSDRAMFNYLSDSTDVTAFVDDFPFWQSNGYATSCAKPLWIDPNNKKVQHIFFDDNIRITDADNIVDVRVFDSVDSDKARSLNDKEMAKFEDMCLIQANLLESASNSDYFINKVDTAEKLYSDYLKSLVR